VELRPLVSGFQSLEGPAFATDGSLYFVDWLQHAIFRWDGQSATEWFNTGGIPAGLAFDREGRLYVADEGDDVRGVIRLPADRRLTRVVDTYRGQPLNGANDLVFAPDGSLYFSDPWRSSVANPIGGFYRLRPDGHLDQLASDLAFPNGVAVWEDTVYLAETGHRRIWRYRDGQPEEWARLSDGGSGPDGMAFDAAGRLHVAHYGNGTVDVFDQAGRQVDAIAVPGRQVTNVAFGGPDGRTYVVTECETGTLYVGRAETPGQPLFGGQQWGV
jgi:gluconolactonase